MPPQYHFSIILVVTYWFGLGQRLVDQSNCEKYLACSKGLDAFRFSLKYSITYRIGLNVGAISLKCIISSTCLLRTALLRNTTIYYYIIVAKDYWPGAGALPNFHA